MTENNLPYALQSIIGEFDEWVQKSGAKRDEIIVEQNLFHYTDANGIIGIVKNEEIWFTSIFHLNDPSELSYGMNFALEKLKSIYDNIEPADRGLKILCKSIENVLTENVGEVFGFYVASFSKVGDDLGQWRAYGGDGRGFSLGLNADLFKVKDRTKEPPNQITFVGHVVYDEEEARQRQHAAIDKAVELYRKAARSFDTLDNMKRFSKKLSIKLTVPILWNSLTCKHSAYRNEQEVRLVIVNDTNALRPFIEVRSRGNALVPFIRSSMPVKDPGAISQIFVGPAASQEADEGVWNLLWSQKIDPLKGMIVRSRIPYRS